MAAPTLSVLSVCSGVGALDLAVRIASPGARTVCHVEREGYAASLLATRMAEGALDEAPIWDDLGTFNGRPWRGKVDCIIAGLPCQPFSTAGARKGHADERAIWPEFLRIVGEIGPTLVFLENVPPFLRYFQPVGERLSSMGYRYQAGIFSAAEVGASHLRERLFVLAVADSNEARQRVNNAREPLIFAGGSDTPYPDGRSEPLACEDGPATGKRPAGPASPSRDVGNATSNDEWRAGECAGERQGPTGGPSRDVDYPDNPRLPDGRGPSGAAWDAEPFPPGPNDRERWGAILAECPDKAPAQSRVRGLAYGAARGLARGSRIDELRGAGNAVVALQAAYALVTLARRLDVML